jgi:hypothetical protein
MRLPRKLVIAGALLISLAAETAQASAKATVDHSRNDCRPANDLQCRSRLRSVLFCKQEGPVLCCGRGIYAWRFKVLRAMAAQRLFMRCTTVEQDFTR